MNVAASSPLAILHLGLGAFHRAHQAVFLQRLIDSGDTRWALKSGNIRPGGEDAIAALQAQGGAYTLETVSPAGERRYQRIEAIRAVLPWDRTLAAVRHVGADPRTRIVSFTVTEAGYHLDASDRLDMAAADVRADIAAVRAGQPGSTIYGALAVICRERMRVGAGGLTLLSCDNLRHNGSRTRAGLVQFVEAVGDAALLAWLAANITSPNAMVDRITPRPSAEIAGRVEAATGCIDAAALTAESYLQWVIEDDFFDGRPAWETVGVEMVGSVLPYEEAKIRLLNASHGCVAWAGVLAGHVHIHESIGDARIRRFAFDYATDDAIPALRPSPVDLPAYRDAVLERFGNAALRDTVERVTSDSFSKLSGFVAPTLRDRLQRNEGIEAVAMLPALFLAFLRRWHGGSLPFAYQEQAGDLELARMICRAADPVAALASQARLWGPMAGAGRLHAALHRATARVDAFASRSLPQESPCL